MYIQAAIEKRSHYRAEIIDPVVDDIDYPEFEEQLKKYPMDLVGVSTYTHSLPDVQKTIDIVRKYNPNATIVLGGPHCAMFPEYAIQIKMQMPSSLEMEKTHFLEIVQAYDQGKDFSGIEGVWWKTSDGQVVKNPRENQPKNLTAYPWPDRRRTRFKDYYLPGTKQPMVTTAITSRGCPHSCPFCRHTKTVQNQRHRRYPRRNRRLCIRRNHRSTFHRRSFHPQFQWVLKFCDAVERRGLKFNWGYKTTIAGTTREQIRRCKDTGCTKIHFGVESANNEGLDVWGKHCDTDDVHRVFRWCREEGVRSVAYIMLAGPHERTMEEALNNLDEMLKLDAEFAVLRYSLHILEQTLLQTVQRRVCILQIAGIVS